MASPSIAASQASAFSAGTSSVNASNPSGITAGQLLLAWCALQGTTTRTTPTGWTPLGTALGGGSHRVYLFGRVATGDAGDTLTLDRSGGSAYVSFGVSRIIDWYGSIGDGVDAGARTITNNGSAASTAVTGDPGGFTGINFGGVSPAWGSADTLWIGGVALESSNLTDPSGYTQAYYADNSGTSHNIEAWSRQNATATEDPPLFGSGGANIAAFFIAVRPAGASTTPIDFDGTIPTLTGTVGAAFSEDLSSYFDGTETPFSYAVQSGTLPAGLSLNSSTGVISGTPTTAGTASGIVIRGTDATPDTADSNSFSIVISPAAATSMTIALKQSDGTTAAASVTGIEYAILNAATLGAATAILDTGTGESTDGSGNLVLDITGLGLVDGNVRYVLAGKSNGTVGADFDGWQGPATAAA